MSLKALIIGFIALLLPIHFIKAGILGLDLELSNGLRQDSFSAFVSTFNPPSSSNSDKGVGTLVATDSIKISGMTFYQIGLKGRWTPCNWIARFEGSYGWSELGNYHDTVTTASGSTSVFKAKVHKGKAEDFIGGVGYLFPLAPFLSAGVVGGWSYHHQSFEGRSIKRNEVMSPSTEIRYSNRWEGPWAGIEAALNLLQFVFHAGYEYHWTNATWKAGNLSSSKSFSERSGPRAETLFCDGRWHFFPCLNMGGGFRMQRWKANHGISKQQTSTIPFQNQIVKTKYVDWNTYIVTFDIGLSF